MDIDKRFDDLPGFIHFDLAKPKDCQDPRVLKNQFEMIIFDPPFFYLTLDQMAWAIKVVSGYSPHFEQMKIGFSFMTRDVNQVKNSFR